MTATADRELSGRPVAYVSVEVPTFNGNHALGGTRHSIGAMRQWFQRLFRLSPGLAFDIQNVTVSGWPWNTTIAVEWIDRATPADGSGYVNEGVHIIKCVGVKLFIRMLTWILP